MENRELIEQAINKVSDSLFDIYGTFYIFSPNELYADRYDTLNYPYRAFYKKNNKFINFYNIMKSYFDYNLIYLNNNMLYKTDLGNVFNKLIINFEGNLDNQDIIFLIYSYVFNITEYAIDFISIYKNILLFKDEYQYFIDINNKNYNSDILFILKLFNNINYHVYNFKDDMFYNLFLKIFNNCINNNDNNDNINNLFNNIENNINEYTINNLYHKKIINRFGNKFNEFYNEYLKTKNQISISLIKAFHFINIKHKYNIDVLFNNINDINIKNKLLSYYNDLIIIIDKFKNNIYNDFNIINKLNDDNKLNYLLILCYYNFLHIQIPKVNFIDIPNFGKKVVNNFIYMNICSNNFASIELIDFKYDNNLHYKVCKSNVNPSYYILSFLYNNNNLLFIHNIPNEIIKFLPNYAKDIINNNYSSNKYINNAINHLKLIIN